MTSALLSLIMDFVVLVALAGTIYYAMRLSKALNGFKAHRDELRNLIVELSSNIDQAGRAIVNLKSASDTAANDLDDVLHDARRMADELKMINETGDSLASRLEGLARRSRLTQEQQSQAEGARNSYEEPEDFSRGMSGASAGSTDDSEDSAEDAGMPSFFIQDMDFASSDDYSGSDSDSDSNSNSNSNSNGDSNTGLEGGGEEFSSQAERELYEALKKSKTSGRRR